MSIGNYRVVFHYEPTNVLPDVLKGTIEYAFVKARNEAIEDLNPLYETWNEEYFKDHEDQDLEEYNKFIQKRQNEILQKYNRKAMPLVKLWSDEKADICGIVNFGKQVTIHITLKPI